MSKYDDYNYEENKYGDMYKALGYTVKRVDNDLIMDGRYVLKLATSHWRDLTTGDKGRSTCGLERLLKKNAMLVINIDI